MMMPVQLARSVAPNVLDGANNYSALFSRHRLADVHSGARRGPRWEGAF